MINLGTNMIILLSIILICIFSYLIFSKFFNPESNTNDLQHKNIVEDSVPQSQIYPMIGYYKTLSEMTDGERKTHMMGKRYTLGKGYKLASLPHELKERLVRFWDENHIKKAKEPPPPGKYIYDSNGNQDITNMLILEHNDNKLYNDVNNTVKQYLSDWIGKYDLEHTATYGMREYTKGSILKPHVDRGDTHVISAIINIKQDHEWPLVVFSNKSDQTEEHIHMDEINDFVYYESATVIHGRPFPFMGNSYVNLFVHFKVPDWNLL